jgi:large subunit ribosomal protein L23
MKNPRDIIKRPVITERSMEMIAEKKFTFEVDVKVNKTEVKDAIEAIFGVKVEKVNIMNYKGKFKRMGKHAGYTNRRRKAIVKLTADSKEIEIFEGI